MVSAGQLATHVPLKRKVKLRHSRHDAPPRRVTSLASTVQARHDASGSHVHFWFRGIEGAAGSTCRNRSEPSQCMAVCSCGAAVGAMVLTARVVRAAVVVERAVLSWSMLVVGWAVEYERPVVVGRVCGAAVVLGAAVELAPSDSQAHLHTLQPYESKNHWASLKRGLQLHGRGVGHW